MLPHILRLFVFGAIWVGLILGCSAGRRDQRKSYSLEDRRAIIGALKAKGYPDPTSIEIADSGFLAVTLELNEMPRQSIQSYAEDAVIAIRNAMYNRKVTDKYRVVLNGPSPGPGLIRRYGVARFIEGDRVTWEPAD